MRKEEMNCKEIRELLTAYLDGEVTPEEKASIRAHLPGCPQCHAELKALSATQASLRGALKLVAKEVSPSTEAWEKVRARLATKGSWLDGLHRLLAGKTWQVATVTAAVVVIVAVAVIWQFGGVGQPPAPVPAPTPIPRPAPLPALQVNAIPTQDSYLPGEEVDIEFLFINTDTEPITVTLFPPEIQIMLPRPHEAVRSFGFGEQELVLQPGETITYNLTWDQRDDNEKQVSPGWYYVDVKNVTAVSTTRTTQSSFGTIAKLLIQFPQGAMEKVIEADQSQTLNGVTITLEQVELSAMGTTFYAFTTPPGYSLPQQPSHFPPPPPPDWMSPVFARYTVDGVTKDAGTAGIRLLDDGVGLTWGYHEAWLDPVPSDAKELIFTITRFGDWQGPWEFSIALEP